MTDYVALKAEIAKPEYDGMGDDAIAAALNVGKTFKRPILASEIKRLWSRWMVLAACWVIADNQAADMQTRIVCRATYDNLIGDVFADIDPENPDQTADIDKYLSMLVGAGALTEEQKAATLALADYNSSWAAAHGWPGKDGVGPGDISAARKA